MEILNRLHTIQLQDALLIPMDINAYEEYGLSRAFHCGSNKSEVRSHNVDDHDIGLFNHWHSFEHAKGQCPCMVMHHHYSNICLLIPALLWGL
jgi:hypothetical protein